MNPHEARWKIVKAMLDSFPSLKKKTSEYLKNEDLPAGHSNEEP